MMNQENKPAEATVDPFDGKPTPEQTYPVTVDGQEVSLTLAQLIDAAAAGLSKRNQAARLSSAAANVPAGQIYAEFVAEYPDVRPEDIPEEVWQDAQTEGSLVSAYRRYENEQLRARLAALEQNERNRAQAVGSAAGEGEPAGVDPVAAALLA